MTAYAVDFSDVQGLVRFGYGALTEATFLLMNIRDARAAASWLATAPITNAIELEKPPATAAQVAITRHGLEALGMPPNVVSQFSDEFLSGMWGEENRSRRLGDVGPSAPGYWRWGGPDRVPHVLLMLFAQPGQLQSWSEGIKGAAWDAAFEVMESLTTSNLHGFEPFGFTDGISQPTLDWERRRSADDQLDYTNIACLGEFLLGYPNEYGRYSDRPLLPGDGSNADLPEAEDAPGMRDLGRNGTYLVLRTLEQDVRGFWQFANRQAGGDAQAREQLASSMVGRTRNGDPLAPLSTAPIPGVKPGTPPNQFTYDSDVNAIHCPFGAHVRRTNPRNADFPAGTSGFFGKLFHNLGLTSLGVREDIKSSTRFHRLLRRGREYGPALSVEQALQTGFPDHDAHGLHFICLNANISRQFEFVQGSWIMNTKFDGMTGESDPLLGNRQPVPGCPATDAFVVPQDGGLAHRVTGLPQFVTVRGGAYFFLPGIRALKFLATAYRS